MLLICQEFCSEFCLHFNPKKSKALLFGNFRNITVAPLNLNGQQIEYTNQWDYLGTTIVSGTNLSFSASRDLRSFFRSANSVLSVQRKPNELVQMKLLYSMCVPILSYDSFCFYRQFLRTAALATYNVRVAHLTPPYTPQRGPWTWYETPLPLIDPHLVIRSHLRDENHKELS